MQHGCDAAKNVSACAHAGWVVRCQIRLYALWNVREKLSNLHLLRLCARGIIMPSIPCSHQSLPMAQMIVDNIEDEIPAKLENKKLPAT